MKWLVACALAGCSTAPSTSDALIGMTAMVDVASSVQSQALTAAGQALTPATFNLDFTSTCANDGVASITGSFDGDSSDDATFDDALAFSDCSVTMGGAAIDGTLEWTSTATNNGFTWTMTGSIDTSTTAATFDCDCNVQASIAGMQETFSGSFCGYDVQSDLHFSPGQ